MPNRVLIVFFYFSIGMLLIGMLQAISIGSTSFGVFALNLASIITYYSVILYYNRINNSKHFSKSSLIKVVLFYSIIYLFLFKSFYFIVTDDFFEFSARDSFFYDFEARTLLKNGLIEGLRSYLKSGLSLEDFGGVFFTFIAYLFYPSTISFNLLNILMSTITSVILFNIFKVYFDEKSALIGSLLYSLSTYVVYLNSTGMKETAFVFLVVLLFRRYQLFVLKQRIVDILLLAFFIASIYLFRPGVMLMISASILSTTIFGKRRSVLVYLVLIIFLGISFYFSSEVFRFLDSYNKLTDAEIVVQKQNLAPTTFNYISAYISSLIGPLPSYAPIHGREQQAFYSIGIGLRVLLSGFFVYGLFIVFSRRDPFLMAATLFVLFEMFVLASLLESFELRLNSPHLFLVYIISFVGLKKYQEDTMRNRNLLIRRILSYSQLIIILIIIFWNLRY